jgi:uncharacterized membrane protein
MRYAMRYVSYIILLTALTVEGFTLAVVALLLAVIFRVLMAAHGLLGAGAAAVHGLATRVGRVAEDIVEQVREII